MSGSTETGHESELIAAVLAGNVELYHELIRPHERRVYIMALSCLGNAADAEDLAQETFVRALRELPNFRGHKKFSMWLMSLALKEAQSRLRQLPAGRVASIPESRFTEVPQSPTLLGSWRKLPSDIVEREDVRKVLEQAVNMMPACYRQVFVLREVEELEIEDAAELLEISRSLVKIRSRRARIMLQRVLARKLATIFEGDGVQMLSTSREEE